ncbi:hypothetical protein [Mycobacteroides abscessus]|uniref:Uncharacterized protein n=1 Tax=Mycobacteroides abscessus subsp. massiliense TaxID=1962118 RepID=A0A1U2CGE0_9MYCO|nr:hypothetical protein [Mycobacteroides abscessus]SKM29157.1 Uncharacterised protein [Mycobacteroides abscessus subsp. massiliense]SKT32437.1 Uncharacterised protein [Mycobacteroides abscessus subsp. massiliense]SKT69416.1 Uncharacterised protein [Mycobacteroides abscessus subsp. massiliense]SKX08615.1 Uncharacterised protein [Mycobacteroides abscessus subsp. massiliense]
MAAGEDEEDVVLDTPPPSAPPAPTEPELTPDDPKTKLQRRLKTVLLGLPAYFEFNNTIAGVNATDLFNLNTLLGASIEGEVVNALNGQRRLWDPDGEWDGFVFERQSQAFPDVRLIRKEAGTTPTIALGIELKGWFLLSKEGKPSFRFTASAAACADHDLLCVVPWYLDNVLAGRPVAGQPYVVSARLAAESRNYYWSYLRQVVNPSEDRSISTPASAAPYPTKDTEISDVPAYDKGGNFGRVARSPGLMKAWIDETNQTDVLGIRIGDWFRFLRAHTDKADLDKVSARLATALKRTQASAAADKADELASLVTRIASLLTD